MERVNEDKNMKKRPAFIVITAVGQEKITEDAFALGANYYILKPFDNDMVISRIKHVRKNCSEKNFQEVRRVNAYESKAEYIERNLETDVTEIIHAVSYTHLAIFRFQVIQKIQPFFRTVKTFRIKRNALLIVCQFPVKIIQKIINIRQLTGNHFQFFIISRSGRKAPVGSR